MDQPSLPIPLELVFWRECFRRRPRYQQRGGDGVSPRSLLVRPAACRQAVGGSCSLGARGERAPSVIPCLAVCCSCGFWVCCSSATCHGFLSSRPCVRKSKARFHKSRRSRAMLSILGLRLFLASFRLGGLDPGAAAWCGDWRQVAGGAPPPPMSSFVAGPQSMLQLRRIGGRSPCAGPSASDLRRSVLGRKRPSERRASRVVSRALRVERR